MNLYNFRYALTLVEEMPETEWPGYLGQIITFMANIIDQLRSVLPIDDGALWIKENIPFFEAVDQPALIMVFGLLVLWLIVAGVSNLFREHAGLFVAGIVVLAVAAYMGVIAQ